MIKREKGSDAGKHGSAFFQKLKLFAWETGLGPVINVNPEVFGQQAVLYFPGRSRKFSVPCHEHNSRLFLALTKKELDEIRETLIQNPGAELWLKNGWFSANVRLLSSEEKSEITDAVRDDEFFGNLLRNFIKPSLKDHYILEAVRTAACTGSSGPGSKAWIWPLTALFLLFTRRKK